MDNRTADIMSEHQRIAYLAEQRQLAYLTAIKARHEEARAEIRRALEVIRNTRKRIELLEEQGLQDHLEIAYRRLGVAQNRLERNKIAKEFYEEEIEKCQAASTLIQLYVDTSND